MISGMSQKTNILLFPNSEDTDQTAYFPDHIASVHTDQDLHYFEKR